jgi:hypothetical protein
MDGALASSMKRKSVPSTTYDHETKAKLVVENTYGIVKPAHQRTEHKRGRVSLIWAKWRQALLAIPSCILYSGRLNRVTL